MRDPHNVLSPEGYTLRQHLVTHSTDDLANNLMAYVIENIRNKEYIRELDARGEPTPLR